VVKPITRGITATLPVGVYSWPSNYPTPASCRMTPARCCAGAPYGVSSWATPSWTSPNSWGSATKPFVAGGRPTSPRDCRPGPAAIRWADEVGVAAGHDPGSGDARRGERATMEVPGPRVRVHQISAIRTEGAVQFMTDPGALNAAVFRTFLTRLVAGASRKVLL